MALTEETKTEDIVDIDLSPVRKKKFRIDGDNNRIIELNTSDVGMLTRFADIYPKLDALAAKGITVDAELEKLDKAEGEEETEEALKSASESVKEIDKEMRNLIDELFDSNVSDICVPSGTMFDPFNGKLRYEYILEILFGYYTENISEEAKKMQKNVAKHTSKYTKKKG